MNDFYTIKQGNIKALTGKVAVYCFISDMDIPENKKNPVAQAVSTNILCATGDYRTQHSLSDFLKNELGVTFDEFAKSDDIGLNIEGLPEGMDSSIIKRKLESMKEFEDLIPTPAKLEPIDSEMEILNKEGDIFYLGYFSKLSNANLAINAFPIMYQAKYREQIFNSFNDEINKLLSNAVEQVSESKVYTDFDNNNELKAYLDKEYISNLFYYQNDSHELKKNIERLKRFFYGYKYPKDIEKLIELTSTTSKIPLETAQKYIELTVEKIVAYISEDYKSLATINKDLEKLDKELNS